jgi:membrane associated rhomboid family serine protease
MKSGDFNRPQSDGTISNPQGGFGLLKALLFVIFVGFIMAVVIKLMSIWVAIGGFIGAAIVLGLIANISDIRRYIRISNM